MEKRLFLFVVLSIVIWGGYLGLQLYFAPPRPKNLAAQKEEEKEKKDKVDNKQADEKQADDKTAGETSKDPDQETKADEPIEEPAKDDVVARQRITLGSLDPKSGYNLLVTLDNRGAAIERIEFNDRFHDLDDFSGYIGHLALADTPQGPVVNLVGPGTPAALAQGDDGSTGLQVGDVITAVNGTAVAQAKELVKYLEKETKAGDEVQLTISRGSGTAAKSIQFTVATIRRPLELIRPEDNSGAAPVVSEEGVPKVLPSVGPPSYRLSLSQVGETRAESGGLLSKLPSLYESNWQVAEDSPAGTVTFIKELSRQQVTKAGGQSSLKVTKTFRLQPSADANLTDDYHLGFQIAIENTGDKAETVAYRLEGPNGLPLEGWWYLNKVHPGWKGAGARDVAYYTSSHQLLGNPMLVSHAAAQVKNDNPPTHDLFPSGSDDRKLAYVAVDTQYFASGLLPGDVLEPHQGMKEFKVNAGYAFPLNLIKDKKWAKTTNVSFVLDSVAETIEPGAENALKDEFVIFAGPKDHDVLEHYQLDKLIEYGWFGWVSRVLITVLDILYGIFKNYGISIILLTVAVRLCLLPFSIRQAKSAAVMQQLAPEIAKLKEKYAGDLEKQAAAQRELFAKHGFNPMGGCLLMFAQLPIFIGLYRCLATDIDLREAPLIPGIHWASNLAGPDQLFRWKEFVWPSIGDEAHGWFGPYFNVLPFITVALFLVQQKLFSPPAIDEEQKMQQKIMFFMTIFMGVMFYKVPAGLCIYFITSSLWGICERKLLPKAKPATASAMVVPDKPDPGEGGKGALIKKPGPGAGPSALEKLFGMADAQLKEAKSSSPRKKAKKH